MLPRPSIVPSQSALRVLYHLAYASSALSAVGLVSLCHVHQQITLREQAHERKRLLRAFSSGSRQDRLAKILQAVDVEQSHEVETAQTPTPRRFGTKLAQSSDLVPNIHNRRWRKTTVLNQQENEPKLRSTTLSRTKQQRASCYLRGRQRRFAIPPVAHLAIHHVQEQAGEERNSEDQNGKAQQRSAQSIHHIERGKDLGAAKERVADRIRKATMDMAFSAPAHVFGYPPCIVRREALSWSSASLAKTSELWKGKKGHARMSKPGTLHLASKRIGDSLTPTSLQQDRATSSLAWRNMHTASHSVDRVNDLLSDQAVMDSQSFSATGFAYDTDVSQYPPEQKPRTPSNNSTERVPYGNSTQKIPRLQAPCVERMTNGQGQAADASQLQHDQLSERQSTAPDLGSGNSASDDGGRFKLANSKENDVVQIGNCAYTSWLQFSSWEESEHWAASENLVKSQDEGLAEVAVEESEDEGQVDMMQNDVPGDVELDHVLTPSSADHRLKWWTPLQDQSERPLMSSTEDQPLERQDDGACPRVSLRRVLESMRHVACLSASQIAQIAVQIQNIFEVNGTRSGSFAWRTVVRQRLDHEDFAALQFFYEQFANKDGPEITPRHHIVQSLVQWRFSSNSHCPWAAEILFPSSHGSLAGTETTETKNAKRYISVEHQLREASKSAVRYLQGICQARMDADWLLINFRRVIGAAKLRGMELMEELFAIVIRYLTSMGNMKTAQAIYDEMVCYHGIKSSFLSKSLLVRGYARMNDWDRVEYEVEALHLAGVSRSQPHGYACLIDAVLQEYSLRRSIEQFQNFIINAISTWGLIPTSSVSSTVVQTYLSARRFDLVREWMETLQILFPKLEVETGLFRWSLADTWQRTKASCHDIEHGLKALVYRNPCSKLKMYCVPAIYEALSRDLTAKLEAARAVLSAISNHVSKPSARATSTHCIAQQPLEERLSSAFSVLASASGAPFSSLAEVIELDHQARSVQRLVSFLKSPASSVVSDDFIYSLSPSSASGNGQSSRLLPDLDHLQGDIPDRLLTDFLPGTDSIVDSVLEFYSRRRAQNRPTDHAVLIWVCEKLFRACRAFDALVVLQKIYFDAWIQWLSDPYERHSDPSSTLSPWPTDDGGGVTPFGIDFFEFWMRLAWHTKSFPQWKRVIEEVLRLSGATATTPPTRYPTDSDEDDANNNNNIINHYHHQEHSNGADNNSSSKNNANHQQQQQQEISDHSSTMQPGELPISASFVFISRFCAAKLIRIQAGTETGHERVYARGGMVDEIKWYVSQVSNRRKEQTKSTDRWINCT